MTVTADKMAAWCRGILGDDPNVAKSPPGNLPGGHPASGRRWPTAQRHARAGARRRGRQAGPQGGRRRHPPAVDEGNARLRPAKRAGSRSFSAISAASRRNRWPRSATGWPKSSAARWPSSTIGSIRPRVTIKDEAAAAIQRRRAGQRDHAAKHPQVRHRAGALEGQAGRSARNWPSSWPSLPTSSPRRSPRSMSTRRFRPAAWTPPAWWCRRPWKRVALGIYEAEQFDGPMKDCLRAQMVVFSGLKADKLDDLEAMINRGKIRLVISAGSLAMALKKAADELDGRQFDLGLAEDPAHKRQALLHPPQPHRAGQARCSPKARAKGIEFVLPVDFVLQDGRVAEAIGPGDQQFDVGPGLQRAVCRHGRPHSSSGTASDQPPAVVFHNGVFGMFEDPRFEEGTRQVCRPIEADEGRRAEGLRRRRRRRHGAGKIRQAGLGHLPLHGRRHGAQRLGQRAGAVSGGVEDGCREVTRGRA